MKVHFICRGNAFRSIIAEAYLRSKQLPDTAVLSSGTAALRYKNINQRTYKEVQELLDTHGIKEYMKSHYADMLTNERLQSADVTILMNKRVLSELPQFGETPENSQVWDIADIGEPGRNTDVETLRASYIEEVYQEITVQVDELCSQFSS